MVAHGEHSAWSCSALMRWEVSASAVITALVAAHAAGVGLGPPRRVLGGGVDALVSESPGESLAGSIASPITQRSTLPAVKIVVPAMAIEPTATPSIHAVSVELPKVNP